ncbi:MAG: hypothetical protein ACJAXX_002727 [Roseivirga sp.]|jgi:hypothetical protein
MKSVEKIWTDLNEMVIDTEVIGYWEQKQSRILERLITTNSEFEIGIQSIAKLLNGQEK